MFQKAINGQKRNKEKKDGASELYAFNVDD